MEIPTNIFPIFIFCLLLREVDLDDCNERASCLSEDPLGKLLQNYTSNNCTNDTSAVEYWMYSVSDVVQLKSGNFGIDKHKPVNIIIHGWGANKDIDYIQTIKNVYLKRYGSQHTVVIVDWGMYAETSSYISSYSRAYCNVPAVSINIASFMCTLRTVVGINPNKIHIVGHSLGAHVAGISSRHFKQMCMGIIGRITGLDPAGPGFLCPMCRSYRLDSNDANFVDIIHSDNYVYGSPLYSGHVDFFVNHGGPIQPGCVDMPKLTIREDPLSLLLMPISCSHRRSCYYFAESIVLNSFLSSSCLPDFNIVRRCLFEEKVYMGEYCKKPTVYKSYEVQTRSLSPFGYGPNGPLY